MVTKKFDRAARTFETRVSFIRDIFTEKFDNADIMAHCIQHKLSKSFENYLDDLKVSTWKLYGQDPMAVLKKIDR